MAGETSLLPAAGIESRILLIRGHKVILDADLAVLYDVSTRTLNQAVKRNNARFPADFMFRLSLEEKTEVITNCDHLSGLKFSKALPFAFTEQGVAMLSGLLNSPRAIQVNIEIMRAFVRLRRLLATNAELARKVDALERKYDSQFKVVFDAIRQLMAPPGPPKKIGFRASDK